MKVPQSLRSSYDDKRAAELRAEYEALGKGGKGAKPKTMEGPIKALERQIELSKALFGLEGDERRRKEVFMQLKFQNRDLLKQYQEDPARLQAIADEVAAQERTNKGIRRTEASTERLSR